MDMVGVFFPTPLKIWVRQLGWCDSGKLSLMINISIIIHTNYVWIMYIHILLIFILCTYVWYMKIWNDYVSIYFMCIYCIYIYIHMYMITYTYFNRFWLDWISWILTYCGIGPLLETLGHRTSYKCQICLI